MESGRQGEGERKRQRERGREKESGAKEEKGGLHKGIVLEVRNTEHCNGLKSQ